MLLSLTTLFLRHFVLDLPFARGPGAGEPGSAPPNRHPSALREKRFQELIDACRKAYERSGKELPLPIMPYREDRPKYVIPRRDNNYAGWWPRGHVSLIAGSSGMGKTTLMLYLLEDLRNGRPIVHHPAASGEYRIVIVDRTLESLEQTLENKGLDVGEVMARSATASHEDGAAPKVLARQLRQWKQESGIQPDVVFLEGVDSWVRKNNDMDTVYRFVKSLEPVAEAWNVAIVASIGSPKIKAKDGGYVLTRDKILGTSAWGRTCETILFVEMVKDSEARGVTILPRTGRSEHLYFDFQDGRAVFSDVPPSEELTKLNTKLKAAEKVAQRRDTQLEEMRKVIGGLPASAEVPADRFPSISKTTRQTRFRDLADEGLIQLRGQRWRKV